MMQRHAMLENVIKQPTLFVYLTLFCVHLDKVIHTLGGQW